MKLKNFKKASQSGFTLVELIIVIVIVGILAAVAIPKLTDTSAAANRGVAKATLGALKSAWSSAYAVNQAKTVPTGFPTANDVAAQMDDPACTAAAAGTITCTNVTIDGTTAAVFGTGQTSNTTAIGSPSSLTLTN